MARGATTRGFKGSRSRSALGRAAEENSRLEGVQEAAGGEGIRAFLAQALLEAIEQMSEMIGNAGQESVFVLYIVPGFLQSFSTSTIDDGWEDVDIGEYMSFTGIIVEEGNQMMQDAYEEAAQIQAAQEAARDAIAIAAAGRARGAVLAARIAIRILRRR